MHLRPNSNLELRFGNSITEDNNSLRSASDEVSVLHCAGSVEKEHLNGVFHQLFGVVELDRLFLAFLIAVLTTCYKMM